MLVYASYIYIITFNIFDIFDIFDIFIMLLYLQKQVENNRSITSIIPTVRTLRINNVMLKYSDPNDGELIAVVLEFIQPRLLCK